MSRSSSRRLVTGAVLFFAAALVFLHACKDQPTGPDGPVSAAKGAAGVTKYTLSVNGSGSTANGTLLSSRGGIKCTIRYANGQVSSSGTCSKALNAGAVVSIDATPVPGGVVTWTGCDRPTTDSPLSCQVTMSANKLIIAAFGPPPNSFQLTVAGGSNGNGSVSSAPPGITCQITAGAAGSTGCDATFPSASQVTLTATAASGSYLTAWSGGGCDVNGTGTHSASGTCVVSMSQAQAIVVSFATNADVASIGQWAPAIQWPNVAIHAHLLPTGKVMTYGRMNDTPTLWDPATGSFTSLTEPGDLFCSGHSLLPDGRLFVTGGHSGTDHIGTKTAFLFDPVSNSWTRSQDMQNGRWYPTNTTLATGEVLTVAGDDTAGVANLIPEVWQNGTWRSLTTASRQLPLYPMMFAAPDGRAFMAGPGAAYYLSTTGTGAWTYSTSSPFSNRDYGSAVMYDVGKILVVGGGDPPQASAEVIDLNAGGARHTVGSMAVARRQMNATLLADGTILATGGTNSGGFNTAPTDSRVLTAELWSPATEQWRPLARMTHNRLYHSSALLLPDGRLLSVGSGEPPASGLTDDYTAEIYSPPYLFAPDGSAAVRPTIAGAPDFVSYGQAFAVQTPDAARIVKATWIRLSSVTHAFNQNQRLNYLPVSAGSASSITLTAPSNANLAPPGDYMLFLIDSNGVPSVAKIIRIG
jgi:hypothetical protein